MSTRTAVEAVVKEACRDGGAQAVANKLLGLMSPAAAMLWLNGYDGQLGGAQPVVVLRLEGSEPVLAALRAFEEGAFA
ncbi:hypothetical protein [Arthrobacter sp. ISL-65]|uniref:hypothetical protein n=1 Tax=Arthrobacter sp. ISL-65 TaxID=2819112 RepID=UPI001BECFC08|nr:hypothetical protein [Arthrobacter sp. ISL-65]MBT2546764.1 hypothetical protein [Arthrobacter sp. ISL-65]